MPAELCKPFSIAPALYNPVCGLMVADNTINPNPSKNGYISHLPIVINHFNSIEGQLPTQKVPRKTLLLNIRQQNQQQGIFNFISFLSNIPKIFSNNHNIVVLTNNIINQIKQLFEIQN